MLTGSFEFFYDWYLCTLVVYDYANMNMDATVCTYK